MSKPGAYPKQRRVVVRSSRLLRFCVKAPNTNSEIGTTRLARPRVRNRQTGGHQRAPERQREIINKTFSWPLEGRHIATSYWGTGIGSNHWKDADVVLLFDDYYVPRRIAIATAHGLLDLKATQGPLRRMKAQQSKDRQVDPIWYGHLLRWLKQLALRGKARDYDGQGRCSTQKVVCAVDRDLLRAYVYDLFPQADVRFVGTTKAKRGPKVGQQTHGDRLLSYLEQLDPTVATVTTKQLEKALGAKWRDIGARIVGQEATETAWKALGWTYTPGKGRTPSSFQRIPPATVVRTLPEENSTGIVRTKRQLRTSGADVKSDDLTSLLAKALRREEPLTER
jgi:hypothetical protein